MTANYAKLSRVFPLPMMMSTRRRTGTDIVTVTTYVRLRYAIMVPTNDHNIRTPLHRDITSRQSTQRQHDKKG